MRLRYRLDGGKHWVVLAAGALHAVALTPWAAQLWTPLSAWMQTAGLLTLLWALSVVTRPGQAAWLAWLYGGMWLVGGTGWTYVSLHRFGGLPSWLAALSVLLLSLFLSVYLALAAACWVRWRRQIWWRDALSFGALWLLAELARAMVLTGFPWAASGYGLVDVSWRWLAPWLGVYGMGAVWAWAVACVVLLWRARSGALAVLSAALLLASVSYQPERSIWAFTKPFEQPLTVSLLQSNVPQDEKFVPELQVPMLLWHGRELLASSTDLVVAPETAVPLLPSQLPEDYWSGLLNGFRRGDRHALFGVPLGSFEHGYTNSVVGLSAAAAKLPQGYYQYDKHHLVPFGEFIPFGFHWFVQLMNIPLGDFSRGPLAPDSFPVKGQRVAPTICYEDLYGEEIAARFTDSTKAPTILANVSNLAWFGEELAIFQHHQIARMRSLEFQIPTIRATNTGATMIVDAEGRVTHQLASNQRGVLVGAVQGFSGVTAYAWWAGRLGLWPLVALALLMAVPFNRIGVLRR